MAIEWWRKALESYGRRPAPPPLRRYHWPLPLLNLQISVTNLRGDDEARYALGVAIAEGRFSDDIIDTHFGSKDEAMNVAARELQTAAAEGHVRASELHRTLIAEYPNKVLLNFMHTSILRHTRGDHVLWGLTTVSVILH